MHKKKDGSNEVSIDIKHYLPSLERKPSAIRNSLSCNWKVSRIQKPSSISILSEIQKNL